MTRQPSWKDIRIGLTDSDYYLTCEGARSEGETDQTETLDEIERVLYEMRELGARIDHNAVLPVDTTELLPEAWESIRNVFKQGIHRGFNDLIQAMLPRGCQNMEHLLTSMKDDWPKVFEERELFMKNKSMAVLESSNGAVGFTSPGEEGALEIMINNRHLGGVVHDAIQTWINTNEILGLIDHAFTYHQVDFLVVPAWSWLSVYSAIAGAPTAIIPLGTYTSGLPFGMAIIGREGTYNADARLLELIKLYENDFAQRDAPSSMRYRLDNLYARSRVSLDALERYSRELKTMTR